MPLGPAGAHRTEEEEEEEEDVMNDLAEKEVEKGGRGGMSCCFGDGCRR